jgi:hypothetical protein
MAGGLGIQAMRGDANGDEGDVKRNCGNERAKAVLDTRLD